MKPYRRLLVVVVFWAALIFCVIALLRQRDVARQFVEALGGHALLSIAVALVLMWAATVMAWRWMNRAWGGAWIRFDVGARHLSLLLVGKYLPGGVWGFLSRHTDASNVGAGRALLLAGLSEQGVNLLVLLGLGAAALLYVDAGILACLGLVALTALACVVGVPIAGRMLASVTRLKWVHRRFPQGWTQASMSSVTCPVLWTLVQQAIFIGVVGWIVFLAFDVGPTFAMRVAGAYSIAVGVGMLALFVPAGILVREGVFIALLGPVALPTGEAVALAAFLRLLNCTYDFMTVPLAFLAGLWRR